MAHGAHTLPAERAPQAGRVSIWPATNMP